MDSHWKPPELGEGGPALPASSPSPGPRKPRLVKQRKQGPASRPQPTPGAFQGGGVGMRLFPTKNAEVKVFREGVGEVNPLDGCELRLGRSESATAEILGSGLGAGKGSESTSDPGDSDPAATSTAFVFGASSGGRTGGGKDGVFAFGANSPAFAFAPGAAKKSSESGRWSSERFDDGMASLLPDEMRRLNMSSSRGSGSQTSTSGASPFVFKSGIDDKLAEEMTKLKVGTSSHSSAEEPNTSHKAGIDEEKLHVYGDSKTSTPEEEINKLKIEATRHVIQEEQTTVDQSKVSGKSSFVFGAGLPNALSEDMRKLNIETPGSHKQAAGSSKDKVEVSKGSFGIHPGTTPTDRSEISKPNSEAHPFLHVQGSKVSVPGGHATPEFQKVNDKFEPSSLSNLHNEIRKLNITNTSTSAKKMENTDRVAAAKFNSAADEDMRKSTKDLMRSSFVKGSKPGSHVGGRKSNILDGNKNTTGEFAVDSGKGLPEKINHFHFVNKSESQVGKGVGSGSESVAFVFGAGAQTQNLSTLNNTTSVDVDMLTKLPDDLERLNIRPPEEIGSAREDTQGTKSAESRSFLFSAGSSSCPLPQENFTPSFTFQARNLDAGSDAGNMTPSHMPINSSRLTSRAPSFGLDFSLGNTGFAFMGSGGVANSSMDHHISKDSSWVSHSGSFTGTRPELSASNKTGAHKNVRPQKRKVKVRKPAARKGSMGLEKESDLQDDSELNSPGSCSPMDFSPYQDTLVSDQLSREASVSSDGFAPGHTRYPSEDTQPSLYDENMENLISAAENMVINEHVLNLEKDDGARNHSFDASFDTLSSFDKPQVREPSIGSQIHATEAVPTFNEKMCDLTGNINIIPNVDMEDRFHQPSDHKLPFTFCSIPDDSTSSNFRFSASSSLSQTSELPLKRLNRKKNPMKGGLDSISSSLNEKFLSISSPVSFLSVPDGSEQIDMAQKLSSDVGVSQISKIEDNNPGAKKDLSTSEATTKPSSESLAALEACEKWRLRGNQAYADGHLSKAEEYYTRGVDCAISQSERCKNCLQALKLCYSNRAAARMSLGRIREALSDCKKAIAIDQNFVKALVRAANCYLGLGEAVDAVDYFQKCLKLVNDSKLTGKMLDEASHGLQKAQKVLEYVGRCSGLIKKNTHENLTDMLGIVSEALTISPYSENLTEMKANALFMLRQYDEVIKLCEKTKDIAERNSSSISSDGHTKVEAFNRIELIPENVWRLHLISKSYFYQGKVEEALQLLRNNGIEGPVKNNSTDRSGNKLLGTLAAFALTLQELSRLKVEGNNAFMAGRHAEAVEYYSKALACSTESRPFSAICFCNRAAAYQALGQITDAIADCSLAIALDANYPKAISRRATLHETIRDYAQAARDLDKLISLLEMQSSAKAHEAGELKISARNSDDIKRANQRLNVVEDEARKGIPLDMYMILGIVSSSSPADIKKAYRKAALKHHPDKACQLLAKGDNNDDTLWKDVASEVHKDADYLFKIIGEAYAVLSDPNKRLQYDAEEDRFALRMEYGNKSKAYEDVHGTKFDKSGSKQQSWSNWTSQGSSHKNWSGYSPSNWHFQKGK